MKKKKKKTRRVKKTSKRDYKKSKRRIKKKYNQKRRTKKRKKKVSKKLSKIKLRSTKSKYKKDSKEIFRKILRFGEKLKPTFKFNFDLDKSIQNFFQKIADKIEIFKKVVEEEKEKKKLEKIKLMQREKLDEQKRLKTIKQDELRKKQEEVREEQKLSRVRKLELRKFIRIEQAQVRKEQAEKQRKFYEQIKLEKKIEQFRKREALEIKNLEKFVLKQEREDYTEVQERIEKIKQKYQAIRDQKIRERIEQLGIEVSENDTRSDLLEKERQFNVAREKIENTLESFYRSMSSCIFQLNKRWLPKKMSLLRVVDRRYENSEIILKIDEEVDENWLMLVYLKDNNPESNIVVEDKTNTLKSFSTEYKSNEIFKFSDALVDSLTNMIDKEFKKKVN
jgi:hypothetical protein